MKFEARDLEPYTTQIDHHDLREGTIYFIVSFADTDLLIPSLEPIIFIGRNLVKGDSDQIYFQDLDSYHAGVRFSDPHDQKADAHFTCYDSNEHCIHNFEQALEDLLRCSIQRKKRGL